MEHAEEFFLMDIDCQLEARHKGEEGFLDFWNKKKWQITMYLTMQPCHLSTDTGGTKPDHSCCKVMIEAKRKLGENVEIVIKPTHLCKANWDLKYAKNKEHVNNANEGVNMLFKTKGIELKCMEEDDWDYLLQYVQEGTTLTNCERSRRGEHDGIIRNYLEKVKQAEQAPEDQVTKGVAGLEI
ncbi:predicted protein [Nematostella vectensis]|uniref:Activation-induced cytidine deaminase AID domain-containing protein n=1 Tax=Nematostella vectensis TaxID=45351 RepID=A7SRQ4_NEMVE|nr:predicted protein [Nematostella vectensis]|eukprot:XP_001625737.1 predicted protein [Nematostella vectensis]